MLSSLLPCFQIIATQWTQIYISKIKIGKKLLFICTAFQNNLCLTLKGWFKIWVARTPKCNLSSSQMAKRSSSNNKTHDRYLGALNRQAKAIKVHAVKIIVISFCNILKIEQSWTESYQSSAGKGFFYAVTMILFQSADLKFKRYW